ncbi:MAG: DUF58 domain-containing protein [Gemmatimonadaceae bacterium]|nr:DUF58 domain-containing protein [Gemmatimonadaceae bacterium]
MNSRFTGEYHSVFKGQGMEFAEVREYQPGDEVRTIDWNVSARMRQLFVKRYVEERELTVLLLVDCSGFVARRRRRRATSRASAAEIAAVLALVGARATTTASGLLLHSLDRVEHVVPPRKGRRHALRLLRDVLALRAAGTAHRCRARLSNRPSDTSRIGRWSSSSPISAIRTPSRRCAGSRRGMKWWSSPSTIRWSASCRRPVSVLADPETGERAEIDTVDAAFRARYAAAASAAIGEHGTRSSRGAA